MWFVALKHIFSRKSQTLLTFFAIVLGAGGYVIFSGIQLGFQEYMIDRLIERSGHITVSTRNEFITAQSLKGYFFNDAAVRWLNTPSGRRSYDKLSSASEWYRKIRLSDDVVAYAPQISKEAIATRGSFSQNVNLVGVDPVRQLQVTNIEQDITAGNFRSLNNGNSLIFVGERLMKFLGAKINDTVNVSTAAGTITPMKIIGTFDTGDRRTDERTVYASLSTVQNATNSLGEITTIVIRVKDYTKAADVATQWNRLNSDSVESWDQLNSDRLSMMGTQDIVRNVTTIAFIVIVAFGIYNILNMVVNHKMRDIAILRSIGYDERDTEFLFLVQGVLVGIVGALAGLVFGYLGCSYIETIRIPMGRMHMMISWDIIIYVKAFFLVVGASVIASYFPARAAGKLSPIEIIRSTI
ncbi:MAG TPA: ABC transporter permease [Spirochaetota bacterium]|nr:ABC transporter permease [Spirochaetota bacterium]HPJ38892.1 ABC transporter permease [Spirochaetota bacterium]